MNARILLFTYHLAGGGAPRVVAYWAEFLQTTGYTVSILTFYPRPNQYPIPTAVRHDHLFPTEGAYLDWRATRRRRQYYHDLRDALQRYLDTHPQDLIIPFLPNPNLIAGRLTGPHRPVIAPTIRNSPWDLPKPKRRWRDHAVRREGHVICQNAEQATYFRTRHFRKVKIWLVHNPLNSTLAQFVKTTYRPIQKIIAIGRLDPQKNYPLMIETIKVLRDQDYPVTLDIYGAGPDQCALQQLIDHHGLSDCVHLCGHTDRLFQVAPNYDLMMMTSRYEGTPNALLEAMGLGLPCVVTNFRTGARELIDHGHNGWIVDQATPNAIAAQIMQINDPKLLEQIGRQARHDVQRYAPAQVMTELTACINDLLFTK